MTAIPENIQRLRNQKAIDSADYTQSIPIMQHHLKPPIWEIIVEIGSQILDEEWEKVPDDASINLKHYLYGDAQKSL
jgi:hypothetical protein